MIIETFTLSVVTSAVTVGLLRRYMREASVVDRPIVTEHAHKSGTPIMGGLGILLGTASGPLLASIQALPPIASALPMMVLGIVDDLLGLRVEEFQKVVRNVSNRPIELGRLILQPGEEARVATEKAKRDLKRILEEDPNAIEIVGEVPIKKELREREKLALQIGAALFVLPIVPATWLWIPKVGVWDLSYLFYPVAVFGIVGATNAVNLIDGMDGLAAGLLLLASLACSGVCLGQGQLPGAAFFASLAGASLGFLFHNRYPAKIFMGDTGSCFLGAAYAAGALYYKIEIPAMIALGVPILSTLISLLHRAGVIRLTVEPLHHHIQYKYDLPEPVVVALHWTVGAAFAAVALRISVG
ncbi:phospho-N-acetylmuramoyl-pentapeptide-transferase [Methanopyrus sp. SNP6]|uniref:phospho-N-acetylmuramoyl-pentapeptide- transferase n=1 Tax=Methanopyrus sp. SNP6 TaxID=1937005 RepID=UPI0011E5C3D0|nr:phospho-N-acetylmuramoyl-pentapeptide-transferase [Methanopyrus sp. SNP6]